MDKNIELISEIANTENEIDILEYIKMIHSVSYRKYKGDEGKHDDFLVNMAVHTMGIYICQFKKPEDVLDELLDSIKTVVLDMAKENESKNKEPFIY